MFTTLSITVKERKTLAERLHLVKKRRFITKEHNAFGHTFFTTELISYSNKNKAAIEKFTKRADMPVIEKESEYVRKIKYIAYTNTAFSVYPNAKSIGIYDPFCKLSFLLEHLALKSGSISVFTRNEAGYAAVAEEIYKSYGTPVVFLPNAGLLKGLDILFTDSALPFSFNRPVLGTPKEEELTPRLGFILPSLASDCDIYLVAAGLYFIENVREASGISCVYNIKNSV